ncbi:MAG: ZIP family metal transporter [Patescibacteria group bacterium]
MSNLVWSLAAVFLVSLLSLVGVVAFFIRGETMKKVLLFFVSFSAGAMMGGAFFHLMPEGLELFANPLSFFGALLVGFSFFFVIEKVLRWRHCHDESCEKHRHLGWMNLIGDGIHNLIDGMIIFGAFLIGPQLGVPVTLSIISHEIPQELSDFGVLIYSGFSRTKALFFNFISAFISFAGVFLAFFFSDLNAGFEKFLLPVAAGGFIYIAASDLIPELHQEKKPLSSAVSFLIFILALGFMLAVKIVGE